MVSRQWVLRAAEAGSGETSNSGREAVSEQDMDTSAVEARPNFREFHEAVLIAAGMYSDVELAFWLTAPQPLVGMWTPIQLLARGEADKLLTVLQQLESGVYV
jgi:hypothetical protein